MRRNTMRPDNVSSRPSRGEPTGSALTRDRAQSAGLFRLACGVALVFTGVAAQAADIYFSPPVTITGNASDILAIGTGRYAYAWNGARGSVTINAVSFVGTSAVNGTIGGNLSLTQPTFYGGSDQMSTASALPDDYKKLVGGVAYKQSSTDTATVTLRNLTAGHQYAAQLWANDSRAIGSGKGTTVSGAAGNVVFLSLNNAGALGGVGQFAIGRFVASGTTEQVTVTGGDQYLNALQLRDVTNLGYWTGLSGSTLDASSANFSTALYDVALTQGDLAAAETAGGGQVIFADAYFDSGAATAVTRTNLTVAVGGVSANSLLFVNTAVHYTLASADGNGIKGASTLAKSGAGQLALLGSNTYAGATVISGGSLRVGNGGADGALGALSPVKMGAGTALVFDRTDNYGGVVSNVISGSGSVVVNGGSLALGGANTYTGPTTVNGGTLSMPNQRLQSDITAWGLLTINSNATFASSAHVPFGFPSAPQPAVDNLISFFVNGGTLSYSGGGNSLQFKNLRLAGGAVALNGVLMPYGDISADEGTTSAIQSGGSSARILLRKPAADTFFTVGSNATLTVGVKIDADTTYIKAATLGVAKHGAGTLRLTADNVYSGSTTIATGSLYIGNGGTTGSLGKGAVTNNAALVFSRSDSYGGAVSNVISGPGSLTLASGTLTLAGTNTYSGATVVSNGVLRLAQAQALSTSTDVSVVSGAKIDLAFEGAATVKSLTVNGVLKTKNTVFSASTLGAALSGGGSLMTLDGAAPKGTMVQVL